MIANPVKAVKILSNSSARVLKTSKQSRSNKKNLPLAQEMKIATAKTFLDVSLVSPQQLNM